MKKQANNWLWAFVIAVFLVGLWAGKATRSLNSIAAELHEYNMYNRAQEQLVRCYHDGHGGCYLEWNEDTKDYDLVVEDYNEEQYPELLEGGDE